MKPTMITLLAAALAASASWAGESNVVPAQLAISTEVISSAEATPAVQADSRALMTQSIDLAWAKAQADVALLATQIDAASPADRAALERRAEARKLAAFVELYSIQARFARADGRLQDAEALDSVVAHILTPAVPVTPVPTTAPTRSAAK